MPNTIPASPLCVMPEASGLTVLVPAEQQAVYQIHMARIFTELRPATQTECELVQRIANTEWRLNRIARLEMGIFATGRLQFAPQFADQDPDLQNLLIETHTFHVYARQLNNLSVQEARLRRYNAADRADYANLQKLREDKETVRKAEAMAAAMAAGSVKTQTAPQPNAVPAPNGFEFSNDQFVSQKPEPQLKPDARAQLK